MLLLFSDVLVLKDLINHASGKKGISYFRSIIMFILLLAYNDGLNFHAVLVKEASTDVVSCA